ncbi:VRR-NUC domain-containing protein [Caloranaerobacter ferrireducens]|uniref:VRR-NUC domain-containing protein n=1 Tax=Caloranaerobacter ferrireducens TaxID=1323370 RepID=UPI00084DF7E8|nr:VRR-NUC domain-containing protein [Caloranaerobacter ferrireducens]
MREKEIESRLKREVERKGGLALKFTSPGIAGVPDRLVLFPGGRTFFVEIKSPGKKLRPLQVKRKKQLEALGFKVYVIDSLEAVEEFIQEVVK